MKRILVANRGEIACRIIRACRGLGLETVAVYSTADAMSSHVFAADTAVCIGPPPAASSYLSVESLVHAAIWTGCDGVHPGYGFLSERPGLAAACEQNGLRYIGPPADVLERVGDKIAARRLAVEVGVPVVPGSDGAVSDANARLAIAREIGFPVILKARSGGGGRGMRVVNGEDDLVVSFREAQREAKAAFGEDGMFIERFFPKVRHVEVQIVADRFGGIRHYRERDCTIQRRHQKILEEAPAVAVAPETRDALGRHAVALARVVGYVGVGTVEFLYEPQSGKLYFIEMNARIQVEHPVTEQLFGIDLVRMQLEIADGQRIQAADLQPQVGHVIEVRINAEDARKGFSPSPGVITEWSPSVGCGIRLESHVYAGYCVPPFYDSLLAKLIVSGSSRLDAVERTVDALLAFKVVGVKTTIPFLVDVLRHHDFANNHTHTRWIEEGFRST